MVLLKGVFYALPLEQAPKVGQMAAGFEVAASNEYLFSISLGRVPRSYETTMEKGLYGEASQSSTGPVWPGNIAMIPSSLEGHGSGQQPLD